MSRTLKAAVENPELADRLRQFEVVSRIAIQLRRSGSYGSVTHRNVKRIGLADLAAREFELNPQQVHYCMGRARNYIDDIRSAERARNAAALKRASKPKPKERWAYMETKEDVARELAVTRLAHAA